jgi:hypothetical protein
LKDNKLNDVSLKDWIFWEKRKKKRKKKKEEEKTREI